MFNKKNETKGINGKCLMVDGLWEIQKAKIEMRNSIKRYLDF